MRSSSVVSGNSEVKKTSGWIEGGLGDRAMTRDLDWGVPVPLPDAEGKVMYVWLDAPIGYISATRQWAIDHGTPEAWEDWWQGSDSELVHFIGKDNIVFHCIIFPILLKTHGTYNLPTNVPAMEFLNLEGDKISTSRNHAVWLHEYLEAFPNRQDELRYVLASIAPETKDSEFTWKDYQARVNNELVAILGNFVNRVVVLTNKYYGGKVPSESPVDVDLRTQVEAHITASGDALDQFKFREALSEAMNVARLGNKYLADMEPWKLQKTDPEKVKGIMHNGLYVCAKLAQVIAPFLPSTSEKMVQMLGIALPFDGYPSDHQIGQASLLFAKVEDEQIEEQMNKLSKKSDLPKMEHKDNISFDDFTKMEIRVGEILSAEKVKKADKLLQMQVSLGQETRTIVSGIAEYYSPDEVIGKRVSVLCNLAPRKIRGVESQGMILMAENSDGKLGFVTPSDDMEAGAEIR